MKKSNSLIDDYGIPEDILAMSIQELKDGIAQSDQLLKNWNDNETGADHIIMIRKWLQRTLEEKTVGHYDKCHN